MKIAMRDIDSITPYAGNPRANDAAVDAVAASIKEFGWQQPIVVDTNGIIIAGHTRWKAAQKLGLKKVPVHEATDLTPEQAKAYRIADNRLAELAEWNMELLTVELADLKVMDVDLGLLGFDQDELAKLLMPDVTPSLTDPDTAPEPPADPVTQPGDLWLLGEHRLLCGDATKAEDVTRVMNGEKAGLVHADPPYGMGKENDGVANDNLYADKLDAFQMAWWHATRPHVADNGSAYIWGNAENLWRLWYRGGLNDSERVTLRNEIVWDKGGGGQGVGTESQRSYYPSERCLFFMLGEQGFNNNADNYWDGWEGIRSKLKADCDKMGWGNADIERICGVGMYSHWFTKSQWSFIPPEHYAKLQAAAREHDAFKREHDELKREHDELKREHDELKREFYATRAYFDNAHDNMTDVWAVPRVTGDERHGHATPKPVAMMARCIKSSAPDNGTVLDPFLGSGTTMIAAEQLGRRCYGIEIEPRYVDVCVRRWQDFTGREATLDRDGRTFAAVTSERQPG